MKNTQRGFTPLIAIIVIVLTVAAAAGTIAVTSFKSTESAPDILETNDYLNTEKSTGVLLEQKTAEIVQEKKEEVIAPVISIQKDEIRIKEIEQEQLSEKNESSEIERNMSKIEKELEAVRNLKQEPPQENAPKTPAEVVPKIVPVEYIEPAAVLSDYNFSYTYSHKYPNPEWRKDFYVSQTSRDLRITKAIFKIADDDAGKFDSITDPSGPPRVWFCKQQCSPFTLERTDKNTFLYVGSKASGIQISQGYLYLDLPIPAFPEGRITNITIPVSEWEIWDNTTNKQVETW
ncbi:hypothetical protein CL644_01145 [bacterium]|nr:hypothetical protein [bacterium]|tara:strand:- start:629 stop:1498 length:870 start_codon:yes stop_codon:yes gene_type:complete